MKNILPAFALAALSFSNIQAQVSCTIDPTNNVAGISPAPEDFPCITTGVYYEEVAQILIPTNFAIATIDSFEVLTVSGYPSNMNYTTNPASRRMNGGERGCFVFYGTTNDPKGYYDIVFTGIAWVRVGNQKYTYPLDEDQAKDAGFEMFIEVVNPGETCRQPVVSSISKIAPTPTLTAFFSTANENLMVRIENTTSAAKLMLVNAMGAVVAQQNIQPDSANLLVLETPNITKGVYTLVLQTAEGVVSKKVMAR